MKDLSSGIKKKLYNLGNLDEKNFGTMEVSKKEDSSHEESIQQSRSFLRERYLRALFALSNKPCKLALYESTKLEGTFRSTDIETTAFQISNLVTPTGVLPEALIRASDVVTITVDVDCREELCTAY